MVLKPAACAYCAGESTILRYCVSKCFFLFSKFDPLNVRCKLPPKVSASSANALYLSCKLSLKIKRVEPCHNPGIEAHASLARWKISRFKSATFAADFLSSKVENELPRLCISSAVCLFTSWIDLIRPNLRSSSLARLPARDNLFASAGAWRTATSAQAPASYTAPGIVKPAPKVPPAIVALSNRFCNSTASKCLSLPATAAI